MRNAIIVLLVISMVLLVGCSSSSEDIKGNSNISLYITPDLTNYSEQGYIQVFPKEDKKIIMLECVNSTLKITETMIYCEGE